MARIYALVAALMGTFAQAPAPTTPSAPVRIAPPAAAARTRSGPSAFADARVVVLAGDLRTRRRLVADWLVEAGPATSLAVPATWATPDAATELAAALVLPRAGAMPRAFGYRAGDPGASHDAILRFVFEADDSDDGHHARAVEKALQVGSGRALADVARGLDARRRALVAGAGRHAFDSARRHLTNLEQLAALRHVRDRHLAAELEARFEAENLKWLVDHELGHELGPEADGAPLLVWPA